MTKKNMKTHFDWHGKAYTSSKRLRSNYGDYHLMRAAPSVPFTPSSLTDISTPQWRNPEGWKEFCFVIMALREFLPVKGKGGFSSRSMLSISRFLMVRLYRAFKPRARDGYLLDRLAENFGRLTSVAAIITNLIRITVDEYHELKGDLKPEALVANGHIVISRWLEDPLAVVNQTVPATH